MKEFNGSDISKNDKYQESPKIADIKINAKFQHIQGFPQMLRT